MLTELIEGLYQSGFPDFEGAIKNDIKLIIYLGKTQINLPEDITPGEDFYYIWWPFVDGPVPDTRILERLTDIAVEFLKREEKVLISCAAGINRSNLLSCLIMMKFFGMSAKDAIEHIRQKNPFALVNDNYLNWLMQRKVQ